METTKEFTVKFDACVEGDVEQEIGFDHCETYKAHRADIEKCVADTIDFLAPHWWRTDILAVCSGYQGLPSSVGTIAGRCVEETIVGFFTLMFISSEIEFARAKLHGNPPEKAGFTAVERIDEYGHFHVQILRLSDGHLSPRQSLTILPLTSCYDEVLGVALRSDFGRP